MPSPSVCRFEKATTGKGLYCKFRNPKLIELRGNRRTIARHLKRYRDATGRQRYKLMWNPLLQARETREK